jgi:hypothetical protein
MKKLMPFCALLSVLACAFASPAQAAGANVFSYVSNTGTDTGNCITPATACGTITYALNNTANYGEIDCVNTGYYNMNEAITITQSVTIDCGAGVGTTLLGAEGGGSGNGVIIVNGTGIVVRLRNLAINREGYGIGGIDALNLAALYVENCVITNINNAEGVNYGPYVGIKFEPGSNAKLFVTNSIISNNGDSSSAGSGGIDIAPASGITAQVVIDHSNINGNFFGVVGDGRSGGVVHATVKDSVISGNAGNGITAVSAGSSVALLLDQTAVTANHIGLFASGSGAAILARNTSIFDNTTGLESVSGGKLLTAGTNTVIGNPTNGAFTGTAALQ